MKEMVSVIIPTYNRARCILDAIKSVLNQTYQDLEVLVVDDGSQDETGAVVKSINDSRIKYIRRDVNCGAGAARNYGVACASGEYIAFHDSDDICRPDRIETELSALRKQNADVVFCAFQRDYGKKRIVPEMEAGFKSFEDILMGVYVSTQTILGKAEVFRNVKFDENVRMLDDYDLMIRVSQQYSVYFVNQVMVDIFYQQDSISENNKDFTKKELLYRYLLNKYQDISAKYPKWKGLMLKWLIRVLVMQDKNAEQELSELLMDDPSKKNRILAVFYRLHLLKTVYLLKGRMGI